MFGEVDHTFYHYLQGTMIERNQRINNLNKSENWIDYLKKMLKKSRKK